MLARLGSRNSVRLSVCHTRTFWLIQRTYRRYFYTTWEGNPSSQVWFFVQLCSSWQDFNLRARAVSLRQLSYLFISPASSLGIHLCTQRSRLTSDNSTSHFRISFIVDKSTYNCSVSCRRVIKLFYTRDLHLSVEESVPPWLSMHLPTANWIVQQTGLCE